MTTSVSVRLDSIIFSDYRADRAQWALVFPVFEETLQKAFMQPKWMENIHSDHCGISIGSTRFTDTSLMC